MRKSRQKLLNGICQDMPKMQNKKLPPAAGDGAVSANGMCGATHGVSLDSGTLRLVFARLVCVVC